jgi:hypothetical protein
MVTRSIAFLCVLLPGSAWLLAPLPSILGFAGGFAVWSVGWGALEYTLHKQDHDRTGSRHMAHHRTPEDPTLRDVDLKTLWSRASLYILMVWMYAGFGVATGNAIGLLFYYINYERVHRLSHNEPHTQTCCTPGDGDGDAVCGDCAWLDIMDEWHRKHHGAWGVNFGVTTPFWDMVEGTASVQLLPHLKTRAAALGKKHLIMPVIWPAHLVAPNVFAPTESCKEEEESCKDDTHNSDRDYVVAAQEQTSYREGRTRSATRHTRAMDSDKRA